MELLVCQNRIIVNSNVLAKDLEQERIYLLLRNDNAISLEIMMLDVLRIVVQVIKLLSMELMERLQFISQMERLKSEQAMIHLQFLEFMEHLHVQEQMEVEQVQELA